MPRPKKDGKMLNIKIQSDIYNTLEKYCDDKAPKFINGVLDRL